MMALSKVITFVQTDIWRIRESELPLIRRIVPRTLKILILTYRGVTQDKVQLRASALTFYSLLSIVPLLAMGFGIAKGFGFEKTLRTFILEKLEGQEQVAAQVVEFARALLENVKGGLVAGIGVVILFYTVIKIFSHIESAFNDIWGITRSRSLGRKITDYFSMTLICPIFFIISSTGTVFITSGAKQAVEKVWLLEAVGPAIFFTLKLLPYGLLWILFSFLYMFMPNTKVNFMSGALAGIIAGTLHVFFQRAYIFFQVGVSKYNAIYGSFAALPLFFIWLQFSWLIVLLGAEVAFAYQNVDTFSFEKETRRVSHSFKRLLSLRIMHFLVSRFSGPKVAWEDSEISRKLEIPKHLVLQILDELVESGIVSRVTSDDTKAIVYQPARDPEILTIKYVIDALEHLGSDDIPAPESETLLKLSDNLNVFSDLIENSPANQRLKEI